jgi:ABC-type proline/glycine betaine transport system permease subunit
MIIGTLVSVGGAYAGNLLLLSVYLIIRFEQGADKTQALDALLAQSVFSGLGISSLIVRLVFSVLAGYVCARVAKHAEYRTGAIVAAVSAAFALSNLVWRYGANVKAVLCLATIMCVFVGVRLGVVRNRE